jgi:F0F1-type ATP synthase membrane subunit b/b'
VSWPRLKRYAWIGAVAVFLFGLWGVKTIDDGAQKVVDGANKRVQPLVEKAEERARKAQADMATITRQLADLRSSLDETAKAARQ